MSNIQKHIVIGLSGGVDSAVAALRLQQAGHQVTALFMKNWEEDDDDGHCSAAEDLQCATTICRQLGISLHTVNFSSEYWQRVFTTFLAEYKAGRTPNPDVLCNSEIKFKCFLDHAMALGADAIATGHYADIIDKDGVFHLAKAADADKDQTYFLNQLNQQQLNKALFPLAKLTKTEVRNIAKQAGFKNHDRKDSTGICFIGERKFKQFLETYLPAQPGAIYELNGPQIGRHDGLMYYTIGQRQGLGIGGAGEAWFVVDKNLHSNILYVAQGTNHPALFASGLTASNIHWISSQTPATPLHCTAKIRYRQSEQNCRLEGSINGRMSVVFETAQRAITPGQYVVFYKDKYCLGGGIIESAVANNKSRVKVAVQ